MMPSLSFYHMSTYKCTYFKKRCKKYFIDPRADFCITPTYQNWWKTWSDINFHLEVNRMGGEFRQSILIFVFFTLCRLVWQIFLWCIFLLLNHWLSGSYRHDIQIRLDDEKSIHSLGRNCLWWGNITLPAKCYWFVSSHSICHWCNPFPCLQQTSINQNR